MSLVGAIIVLAAFILAARHYWREVLAPERTASLRPFWVWVRKGLLLPVLWWVFFNSGLCLPPLMPQIEIAATGADKFWVWLDLSAVALWVIATYWGAMTFCMLAGSIFKRAEERREFIVICGIWTVLVGPVAWLILHWSNLAWVGFAVFLWAWPIVHTTAALAVTVKRQPTYSRAIAGLKLGKVGQAEWAVLQELEKCEDDVEGWLMLAELYAVHRRNLKLAEQTIHETCRQPNITPSQIGVAFHRLADWHLSLADDPVAARRALEEISRRLPGTHLDRMARLRASQLPAAQKEFREERRSKPIHLPALSDSFDDSEFRNNSMVTTDAAAAHANMYVEKLKRDPNDVSAREELARILAKPLEQIDLAIEQIRLLLEMPDQPPSKRAEWLGLIAAWQFKNQPDPEDAVKTLRQIMAEYPQSPQAFAAQRRLALMDAERRAKLMGRAPVTGKADS